MRRKTTLPALVSTPAEDPALGQKKVPGPRLLTIMLAGMMAIGSGLYVAHLHSQRLALEKVAQQRDVTTELLRDERDRLQAETTRLQSKLATLGTRLNHREQIVSNLDRRRQDLEEKNLALLEKRIKVQQEQTAFNDDLSARQSTLAQPIDDRQALEEELEAAVYKIERERVLRSELVATLAEHEEAFRAQAAALASAKRDKLQAEATIDRLRKELQVLEPARHAGEPLH